MVVPVAVLVSTIFRGQGARDGGAPDPPFLSLTSTKQAPEIDVSNVVAAGAVPAGTYRVLYWEATADAGDLDVEVEVTVGTNESFPDDTFYCVVVGDGGRSDDANPGTSGNGGGGAGGIQIASFDQNTGAVVTVVNNGTSVDLAGTDAVLYVGAGKGGAGGLGSVNNTAGAGVTPSALVAATNLGSWGAGGGGAGGRDAGSVANPGAGATNGSAGGTTSARGGGAGGGAGTGVVGGSSASTTGGAAAAAAGTQTGATALGAGLRDMLALAIPGFSVPGGGGGGASFGVVGGLGARGGGNGGGSNGAATNGTEGGGAGGQAFGSLGDAKGAPGRVAIVYRVA